MSVLRTIARIVVVGIFFVANASAQADRVTLHFTETPLKEILTDVSQRYGLQFSYGNDLPALDQPVSIEATDQPLNEFLDELFKRAGISYKMVNRHVALNRQAMPVKPSVQSAIKNPKQKTTKEMPPPDNMPVSETRNVVTERKEDSVDTLMVSSKAMIVRHPAVAGEVSVQEVQEQRTESTFTKKEESTSEAGSRSNRGTLELGIITSVDFYNFNASSREGVESTFSVEPDYSIGLYAQQELDAKWSVDMQARLSTRNMQVNYNYRIIDQLDPLILDKTSFRMLYLSIPIRVNYLFLERNKLQVTGSLGTVSDFRLKEEAHTRLLIGEETTAPEMLGVTRVCSIGALAGVRVRYALSERLAINLSPVYRYYFTTFTNGAMDITMSMVTAELGLLFRL